MFELQFYGIQKMFYRYFIFVINIKSNNFVTSLKLRVVVGDVNNSNINQNFLIYVLRGAAFVLK